MKRILLSMLMAVVAIGASAQFKSTVTAGVKDYNYHVSYNFEDVCQSLGVTPESFGHALEVWLDPYRFQNWPDEYSRHEAKNYMFLVTRFGKKVAGRDHRLFNLTSDGGVAKTDEEHWACTIHLNRERNRLDFEFNAVPYTSPRLDVKPFKGEAGDTYHYTFGIMYKNKQATFDITINMVPEYGGNLIPKDSFEKVGEQDVRLIYQHDKNTYSTHLKLDEIAQSFGGNVKGGNLGLYLAKRQERGMLTDRYSLYWEAWATLDETMAEGFSSKDSRAFQLTYIPEFGELLIYPLNEGGFEEGEHVKGSVFLVADGKYYELKVDEQIGNPKRQAHNLAVLDNAEQCGTLSRTLTLSPNSGDDLQSVAQTSFSLPVLAKALGTDCDRLTEALAYWMKGNVMEDGSEMVYNLTEYASTNYCANGPGSFMMTKEGTTKRWGGDYTWTMGVNRQMKELQFSLWQERGNRLADGDVCNTRLGLYYEGRMVTLDLTLYLKKGKEGTLVPLESLKKVGERVISAKMRAFGELRERLDLDGIASHFSSGVAGKGLKVYVMDDLEKGLLTDRYSYHEEPFICLNIEGTSRVRFISSEYFSVTYRPNDEMMLIYDYDGLRGGQKTSASLFLTDGEEYYELVLDIQFGEATDERENFEIVSTRHLDVQIMPTSCNYTYYDRESNSYALVSTPIDGQGLAETLGTETPMLFAEQTDETGRVTLSSRYNCSPGQGFWVGLRDGQAYRDLYSETGYIGVYYADGAFKWYEDPYPALQVGGKYRVNLYMANIELGTAVKYEIDVEVVREIEAPSIAYVHRLPVGLDAWDGSNGIQTLKAQGETHALYDLSGRRLQQKPQKGIYIQDGKKVLVK